MRRLLREIPIPNVKSLLMKALGVLLALAIVLPLSAAVAATDPYPNKQVRLVINFAPGGITDTMGRLVATRLAERLRTPVVPDNRGGAGGVIGIEIVAKSEPDGYTLLFTSPAIATNPSLYKVPYDPVKSFTPIGLVAVSPQVLAVYSGLPVKSVKELIALAKSEPNKLAAASSGVGGFGHLATLLFTTMAGIDIKVVQFKSGGLSMTDVLGGHSQISFASAVTAMPYIKSGQIRGLGVSESTRSTSLPDVPTISEAGVPGYEASNWLGILAPAGTPKEIVDRLSKELAIILNSEDTKKTFERQGAVAKLMGPAEFGKFIEVEVAKWGKVIKEANIKVEMD